MDNINSEAQGFSDENSAYGITVPALATAAALDSSTFSSINANDAIPTTWEDRARKAWEYYVEEPLVKNCVNSWRTFAVGDEIKITSDDDAVKSEANDLAARLGISEFVKDMILQLLVKGNALGQKMVMPDQKMLEQVRDMVNKMDLKSGLVVPFYVTVETHGTEGQVLNVEDKVKEVKEDIVVALGLSRSLVAGDGPNFATASVSMQKMLIMIREIKHAARTILEWIFDDWLELSGHAGKSIQFLFNDLDPTDAVDFKKLLIELYDRKLISRSSLQLKMDLDPDIEEANRQSEGKSVDLLDEKQVKPIVDMVVAGIMSVETAQEMLGLDPEKNRPGGESQASAYAGEICDSCGFFDAEKNRCNVTHAEVTFDSQACRHIIRRGSIGS